MIFFVMNFFKIVFIDFIIFNIELIKNYKISSWNTIDCYNVSMHSFFFPFVFFCYDFFQKIFYSFYFLNIK